MPSAASLLAELVEPVDVERDDDLAAPVDAFLHAVDALARHQRIRLAQPRHVDQLLLAEPGHLLHRAPDHDRVLVTGGGEECGLRAGVGDQRVRGDRRAVREHDRVREQLAHRHPDALGHPLHRVEHSALEVRRR